MVARRNAGGVTVQKGGLNIKAIQLDVPAGWPFFE
jgi:hypothetical protein